MHWSFTFSFIFLLLVCPTFLDAQTRVNGYSVEGTWKILDEESGTEESYISIWEDSGYFYGQIEALLNYEGENPNPVCSNCWDYRENEPLIGMHIISDMQEYKHKYGGGEILDPQKGKVYTCTMWLEDQDTLKVRGWWGFFYRTQTWYRVN